MSQRDSGQDCAPDAVHFQLFSRFDVCHALHQQLDGPGFDKPVPVRTELDQSVKQCNTIADCGPMIGDCGKDRHDRLKPVAPIVVAVVAAFLLVLFLALGRFVAVLFTNDALYCFGGTCQSIQCHECVVEAGLLDGRAVLPTLATVGWQ